MTKRTHAFFALFFSVFLIAFTQCAMADQSLNAVAAVVNNEIITQSELNNAVASAKQQLAASANPNALSDTQLRKMVLQQLIDEKLQLELAQRAKVTVTDAEVTQTIQHIAQGNGMTVTQLKDKLQQEGMSYSAYRKMIHKQLLVHHVQQGAVAHDVGEVTAQDKQKALAMYQSQMSMQQQQYHVIDILANTKQDAEQIMLQLKKGADIKTVAPNNTTDLGWQTSNTLPTLFLQQLSTMQKGDIAGPIQAPNGYHVIVLMGVHGQANNAPSDSQLQNIAYQMKFQQAVKKWLKSLRKTAYIKIN